MRVKVTVDFIVEEQTPHLAKHLVRDMIEGDERMTSNYNILPRTEILEV